MPIRMSGLVSGLDTEAIVGALMSAQSLKKTKITNAKTKLEWKQTKWKDLNTKLYGFYTGATSKMRLQSSYQTKKADVSNSSVAGVQADANAVNGTYTLEVNKIATSQYLTSGKLDGVTDTSKKLSQIDGSLVGQKIQINGTTALEIDSDTTIAQFTKKLAENGINANYDTNQQRFFISSKKSGEENAFTLTSLASDGTNPGTVLTKLKIGEIEKDSNAAGGMKVSTVSDGVKVDSGVYDSESGRYSAGSLGMTLIAAADSEVVLNGATLTSSSATLTANGVSLSLTSKGTTSFTVSTDVDAIYKSIKSALTEYNTMLKELNTLYSADPAKDYEPLTSEQKKALSDNEVEEWEKKIKDSLLRNDYTIDSIRNSMKNAMQMSVSYNDRSYSLIDLGIMTSTDWTEGGQYHIYGDVDDPTYADQNDKLRKAIEEDPEMVTTVMTKVFGQLHDNLYDKMKATSLSSALTFYNDVQLNSQLKDYKSELSEWETRLEDMESAYYSKFTAMEKAMAKMQSQQSSLGAILGG